MISAGGERMRGCWTNRGVSYLENLKDVSVFHEAAGLFPPLLCDKCRAKVFYRTFTLTLQGECFKADCNMTSISPYSRL